MGEGETTVDRDMHAVSSPGHDGRKKKKKKKGRHDELGYHSSAPKASAARGGSVYIYDRVFGRESVMGTMTERKERNTYFKLTL